MSIINSCRAKSTGHFIVTLADLSICSASNMICKLFKKLHHATLSIKFLRRICAKIYNASSDVFYKKARGAFFHIERAYSYLEKATGSTYDDRVAFVQFWQRKVPVYSSQRIWLN